jgi:hypothetical protein
MGMGSDERWDLRLPSGIFFAIVGAVLLLTGWLQPEAGAPLASSRVNLAGGALNLVFGGSLIWLSTRRR